MKILYMKTTYKKNRSVIILMLFTTQIRAIRYFLRGDLIVFEFNLNQSILHIDLLQRFEKKKKKLVVNYGFTKIMNYRRLQRIDIVYDYHTR